ncbi:MAG: hypothetical protein N2116_02265 [Armatimonadetes bacterium]|nr:hypothetical protein [Armatimonadota bacterium]
MPGFAFDREAQRSTLCFSDVPVCSAPLKSSGDARAVRKNPHPIPVGRFPVIVTM